MISITWDSDLKDHNPICLKMLLANKGWRTEFSLNIIVLLFTGKCITYIFILHYWFHHLKYWIYLWLQLLHTPNHHLIPLLLELFCEAKCATLSSSFLKIIDSIIWFQLIDRNERVDIFKVFSTFHYCFSYTRQLPDIRCYFWSFFDAK